MSHMRETGLPILELTEDQVRKLERLWFIYCNMGKYHTDSNHKFIQRFLDAKQDQRKFYRPTAECIKAVDAILNNAKATTPNT